MDALVPANTQLLDEVLSIVNSPTDLQLDWLNRAGNMVMAWDHLRSITTMREAEVLYAVHKIWPAHEDDADKRLSWEAVMPWDADFFEWARAFTRKQSKEPANVTILNKVSVYRDWASSDEAVIEYPETVDIPKRNHKGAIDNPDGVAESDWVQVTFDPRAADYAKLLVARGTARKGEMPPEAWTAIADPYSTVDDVRRAMKGEQDTDSNGKDDSTLRIWFSDGLVYATKGEFTAAFMMVLEDSVDIPLVREALARILGAFGEVLPDDIAVTDVDSTIPMVQKTADSLVISAAGKRFAELKDTAELMQIHDLASDLLADRGIVMYATTGGQDF